MRTYLDFEKPIEEINSSIEKTNEIGTKESVDNSATIKELQAKLEETTRISIPI